MFFSVIYVTSPDGICICVEWYLSISFSFTLALTLGFSLNSIIFTLSNLRVVSKRSRRLSVFTNVRGCSTTKGSEMFKR